MQQPAHLAVELPAEAGPASDASDARAAPDAHTAPDAHAGTPHAALAAHFIPAGARVLDLSGGDSGLEPLLPHGCSYQRAALNAGGFPAGAGAQADVAGGFCAGAGAQADVTGGFPAGAGAQADVTGGFPAGAGAQADVAGGFPAGAGAQADVIVMLDGLDDVADVDGLFRHLRLSAQDVLLRCSPSDLGAGGARDARAARAVRNRLSFYDLALLFDRHGFRIQCTAPVGETEMLMRLTPAERILPSASCSVAVISEYDLGGFGERLGYHMINALLPSGADVHHLSPRTLHEARSAYDLVVLGTGNSVFPPLIGDDLLEVLGRGKSAIGIFGTYFRELIPRPSLERIIDRLDTWYARTRDDVLIYGRGRDKVVYLGDWMIEQFPLAQPCVDEPLRISEEIGAQRALDRAIQIIQRHRHVHSNQLHPLLCALTSAEVVAYADQSLEHMPHLVSGNFRSMLIDIFGRSYPENEPFLVDREAVARYKARVHTNVAMLREQVEARLASVAVAAA